MTIFAVLQNIQITNVIVADTQEIAEMVTGLDCVELPEDSFAGIGWTYVDGNFVAPVESTVSNSII